MSRVVFASDHAGFHLKEFLKPLVAELGFEVMDVGAHVYDEHDDYPDFCAEAAARVAADPDTVRAIIIGGSGQGEAMVANRFPGVRAVVYNGESDGGKTNDLDEITLSRVHNNANTLSLGARFLSNEQARDAVVRWLSTEFPGEERHLRRILKIDEARSFGNDVSQ